MQVRIEKIVYPGKSLASLQGKIVFTDEGLPGEIVEVQPIKEKKSYIEAKTLKIIESSTQRVKTRCHHYQTCSSYQYIDYSFQVEIKKIQVQEILWHDLKIALKEPEAVPSSKIWRYRNKVRLNVVQGGREAYLAFHRQGFQDEFVKVDGCFLVPEQINSFLKDLLRIINEKNLDSFEEVEVKESASSKEMLLVLYGQPGKKIEKLDSCLSELKAKYPLAGVVCEFKTDKGYRETSIWGKNFIEEKIGEISFHLGPQSFFQVNSHLLPKVITDFKNTLQLKGSERIADLYCGLGTFGVALASEALEVYGVESSAENLSFLKKNLRLNRITNFTVCEGTSEEWTSLILDKKIDSLILDPPRKGLGQRVIQSILKKPVHTIIYLSCNPSTLSRDLKSLLTAYSIKNLRIYDFFPHTPHLETCVLLKKN